MKWSEEKSYLDLKKKEKKMLCDHIGCIQITIENYSTTGRMDEFKLIFVFTFRHVESYRS